MSLQMMMCMSRAPLAGWRLECTDPGICSVHLQAITKQLRVGWATDRNTHSAELAAMQSDAEQGKAALVEKASYLAETQAARQRVAEIQRECQLKIE